MVPSGAIATSLAKVRLLFAINWFACSIGAPKVFANDSEFTYISLLA